MNERSGCPINLTLEVVGDKWSLLIIRDIMMKTNEYARRRQRGPLKIWPTCHCRT